MDQHIYDPAFPGTALERLALRVAIRSTVGECWTDCGQCVPCRAAQALWDSTGADYRIASGLVQMRHQRERLRAAEGLG